MIKNRIPTLFYILITFFTLFASVFSNDNIGRETYRERRDKIISCLTDKSIALVFSSDYNDNLDDLYSDLPQNSNMLYLTGLPKQKAVLLLSTVPVNIEGGFYNQLLFVEAQEKTHKTTYGALPDLEDCENISGVDKAVKIEEFDKIISNLLADKDTVFIGETPRAKGFDMFSGSLRLENFDDSLSYFNRYFPYNDALKLITGRKKVKIILPQMKKMREIKSEAEISLIRQAIEITTASFKDAAAKIKPGLYEYQVQAEIEYGFMKRGGVHTAYKSIIGSGPNSCFVHSSSNKDVIPENSTVLIDCGAEYKGYASDITRTFPSGGKFTSEQRQIYNIVLEAADSAILMCQPGKSFMQPHLTAYNLIANRLKELGIINELQECRTYFTHGTSHYLGIDVHDLGSYGNLKPGVIITIEPGIYIPAGSPCDKKWWNTGIRIEDDVLITDKEPEIMSKSLPRKAEEIEELMKKQ